MRKRTFIIWALMLIIALMAASFGYHPLKRFWYGYLNKHAIEHYTRQMQAFNLRRDGNLPPGAVLFYGDSLVQGLSVTAASPMAVNYGIGHARSDVVLSQLRSHSNVDRAAAVVLAFGINDVMNNAPNEVPVAYRQALKLVPSTVPVIVSLVLPVDETTVNRAGVSGDIAAINDSLEAICAADSRVTCVDAASRLANTDGQLGKQYHVGDGLHLSARGNAVWLEQLRLAITETLASQADDQPENSSP